MNAETFRKKNHTHEKQGVTQAFRSFHDSHGKNENYAKTNTAREPKR